MYQQLNTIFNRPEVFEVYTAEKLWNDPHISKQMLEMHLNPDTEPASRLKEFIDRSIDWMVKKFHIGQGFTIADFGCGPGLYSLAFAQKGAAVMGIDFSERSIGYALSRIGKKGLDLTYTHQNYLQFDSPDTYDLITLIYCDFCALNPNQRQQLLKIFHRHLKPGGQVFLDVFSRVAYDRRKQSVRFEHRLDNGFWSEKDYFGFQNTFKYSHDKVALDKYTIVEPDHGFEVFNWLQYYSMTALNREFERAGFRITETLGDVAGAPFQDDSDTIAVIAQKG